MRKYEGLNYLQENRLKQRAYYIPENEGGYVGLNGDWGFAFYERAKKAYLIIATGEMAIYANVLLKKGVVKPE